MRIREMRLVYVTRDAPTAAWGRAIYCARDGMEVFAALLEREPIEVFALLALSTKHTLMCYHEISRGTLDASIVHPREVFKAALMSNAAAIVVGHNHPSGDPTPSDDDVVITRRLIQAGTLLGVSVLDHLVIGEGRHYSFRDSGRL